MKSVLFTILALYFVVCLPTTASAAIYEVAVKSIAPSASVETVICKDNNEICFLSIPYISEGHEDYLDIAIRISDGEIDVDFMLQKQRLSVSVIGLNYFEAPLEKGGLKARELDLYILHPQSKDKAEEGLRYKRPSPNIKIAKLELSVERVE